jgi:hypothetical protein
MDLAAHWQQARVSVHSFSDEKTELGECIIANSLTEQCGHKTLQICGFWASHGQTAPYCLIAPTGVAMPPGTAGLGNRDRFELNGKIGLVHPRFW